MIFIFVSKSFTDIYRLNFTAKRCREHLILTLGRNNKTTEEYFFKSIIFIIKQVSSNVLLFVVLENVFVLFIEA